MSKFHENWTNICPIFVSFFLRLWFTFFWLLNQRIFFSTFIQLLSINTLAALRSCLFSLYVMYSLCSLEFTSRREFVKRLNTQTTEWHVPWGKSDTKRTNLSLLGLFAQCDKIFTNIQYYMTLPFKVIYTVVMIKQILSTVLAPLSSSVIYVKLLFERWKYDIKMM